MTPHARAALVAGLLAGAAGGLFGVGGGIILVPLLTGWLALSQHQAHGTSLGAIAVAALASLVVYAARGDVEWRTALLIAPGSLLTAQLGANLAAKTSAAALKRAFAAFTVLVALRLLWRAEPLAVSLATAPAGLVLALELLLGAAAGLLAGYMGVGGGVIIVPALVLLWAMDPHSAQGTSLAVILVTAPAALLGHARHGHVAWGRIPALAAGAALGGPVGSAAAHALPGPALARGFALFLLVNAALTWHGARRRPSG